ncbi:hypothetical protein [Leucobacter sp. NPDC077196]|uniref:hypothetical protein n=1 Tax=Leucobacter sp. NPDC077196 TaxID=3154959 RepID=UPI00343BAFD7
MLIVAGFVRVPAGIAFVVFWASLIAGLVLAVVSLARRERPAWAAWTMGLIIATPILFAVLAATAMSIAGAFA